MKNDKTENDIKGDKIVSGMTTAVTFLIIVLVMLFFIGIWIYLFGINNIIINKISGIIPYPAAIADNKIISAYNLKKELDAVKTFYSNQDFSDAGLRVDFSTPDGQKRLKIKERRILTKLIENALIEKEANRRDIKLTDKEISEEVDNKAQQYGDNDFLKENIKNLYDWNIDDFEKNIVKPDIYAKKLYENIRLEDQDYVKAQAKIKQAKSELENSKNFDSIVAKYSEGDSVKDRGDLGWYSINDMLPEIAQAITNLEKGKNSDIIESSIGYHIVRIEEKKTENDVEKFHIRQIFIRIPSFAQWLSKHEKEVRITIPLKGYVWDKNIGEVQFTDPNMKAFEDNLQKNSADDISVLF
ncbi:MAG TPA: peptidylprolyl isomerase [Patescibacteria group bacterium]|nr:peptidylprolyl isomerase [Patescibacteria group bacterium]